MPPRQDEERHPGSFQFVMMRDEMGGLEHFHCPKQIRKKANSTQDSYDVKGLGNLVLMVSHNKLFPREPFK